MCNTGQSLTHLLLTVVYTIDPPLTVHVHCISPSTSRDGDSHDVDMRDTETHPGTPDDSDRDSTTVSYSLDEDNLRDIEEESSYTGDAEVGGV